MRMMSVLLSSRLGFRRWLALALGAVATGWAVASPAAGKVVFNRDIRPILSDNCFACHGFDAKHRKAGLRLDLAEGAFTPNKEGVVAIKPGKPDESELWRRIITADEDDLMPPAESHKKLTAEQKELLRQWIAEGAVYQKHWAFEPPVKTEPQDPKLRVQNPVDGFIRARLKQENLSPAPEADRATLIRRVAFDLTGLPPTPAEVDRFVRDKLRDAYEQMVQRYLDSPRYGEHMAKHWLDVARYADTHGMHLDNERQMWAYRDWVVQAFNRNLPFDQFTVEQLAGDLLPEPTQDQLVATGFNRCNVTTGEGGSIDAEWIYRYAVERTSTTVQAWMGLTAGCAVCHDHKFDPLSQKEFYSLYAFFHSAADPAMDGNTLRTAPMIQLKTPADERRLEEFATQIKLAEAKVTDAIKAVSYTDPATLIPPPEPRDEEVVWLDDEAPAGWKAQGTPKLVTAEAGKVFSGKLALRREEGGVGQDVFESDTASLAIPQGGKLFAHVFLDPKNLPKAVMLQFNPGDSWEHRAIWGDADAIGWGEKDKPSRVHLGDLPKAGEWVRLEFDAAKVGLKAGDKLKGLAYTQSGGTVFWDKAGVVGRIDPVNDPLRSFAAWTKQYDGKEAKELPEPLRKIFKDVAATNRTPEQVTQLRNYFVSKVCLETKPTFDPLNSAVAEVRKQRDQFNDAIPQTFTFRDLDKPRDSFVMLRGAYDKPGEKVTRNVPAVFPPLANTNNPNRLDLAKWLVAPENPLTARVAVNRLWQQFLGIGLVKTADDFGSQGQPPSHPELLDWLAVTFRESGWDVKGFVKLLLTSATSRQSSQVSEELVTRDPENRLLARAPRFRLDAEQLRDNALFVSGLLDPTMGGKGVKPYQPPNIWEPVGFVGSNTREYKQDTGSALYRRSLYTFIKRTAPPPFMASFDAPNREQSCTRRERSNTPLQALQLMNDVQHFEAARAFAERMLTEGGRTPEERLAFAYRTLLSRLPSAQELAIVTEALEKHLARYQAEPDAAKQAVTYGESKPLQFLPPAEVAAYTLTANLLLNLDETVTRN
jgi:mono/diheme cytochrome c family protein